MREARKEGFRGLGVLGFWGFGGLGFWGFGVLGFWGFGVLGFSLKEFFRNAVRRFSFNISGLKGL